MELYVGDADDILDPAMSTRLGRRIPDCTLHRWPGAGHYAVYGRWGEFTGSLVRPPADAPAIAARRVGP